MNQATKQIIELWQNPEFEKKFVYLDEGNLDQCARNLATYKFTPPDWKMKGAFPENHAAFISQSLFECAIDFCFTNPENTGERFSVGDLRGSAAMAACFYRQFENRPVDCKKLIHIMNIKEEAEQFFRGNVAIPLLDERREFLIETAEELLNWFDGDPKNLLECASYEAASSEKNSDKGILELLQATFPKTFGSDRMVFQFGKDQSRSHTLHFNKRAQLWPLVYQGRALNSDGELKPLKNIEEIGPIADCAVPNALRKYKILLYEHDFGERIAKRQPIEQYGQEETEIRVATIYAVAKMLNDINEARKALSLNEVTIVELDNLLWSIGRNAEEPYHITKTTAY
ncbi:MAG: hypothetical protein G01um10143_381 [Parcubacteria group bacterium Gr01-1014_3]|nr:MAG: hypothetical protein G01um10143_381 [Parcubacteria group bacterium Gr01-1014_3]